MMRNEFCGRTSIFIRKSVQTCCYPNRQTMKKNMVKFVGLLLLTCLIISCYAAPPPPTVTIGLLLEQDSFINNRNESKYDRMINYAIHEAERKYQYKTKIIVRYQKLSSDLPSCNSEYGFAQAYILKLQLDADVIFDVSCSAASDFNYYSHSVGGSSAAVTLMSSIPAYNIPVYTSSISMNLTCLNTHPPRGESTQHSWFLKNARSRFTVTQLGCVTKWFGTAVIRLFDTAGWNTGHLLYVDECQRADCNSVAIAIRNGFAVCGLTLSGDKKVGPVGSYDNGELFFQEIADYLKNIKGDLKIVIICGPDTFLDDVLHVADNNGLLHGDEKGFVFVRIVMPVTGSEFMTKPWLSRNAEYDDVVHRYKRVYQISLVTAEKTSHAQHLLHQYVDPSLPLSNHNEHELKGPIDALVLHDMILYYMKNVNEMCAGEQNEVCSIYRSGVEHFNLTAGDSSFRGLLGRYVMNGHSRRQCDYWVWQLDAGNMSFMAKLRISLSEALIQDHKTCPRPSCFIGATFCTSWLKTDSHSIEFPSVQPSAKPPHVESGVLTESALTLGLASVFIPLILVSIILAVIFIRMSVYDTKFQDANWLIKIEELNFATDLDPDTSPSVATVVTPGLTAKQGHAAADPAEIVVRFEPRTPHEFAFMKRLKFSLISSTAGQSSGEVSKTRRMADYMGNSVSVKTLPVPLISWSKKDATEMEQLKVLNHDNLDKFYGVCIINSTIMFVSSYCGRGTLQEILDREFLDDNFKMSFIRELIYGMRYLHNSPLKVHGRLRSSCCVLDSRWTLKITDLGLGEYRVKQYGNEFEKYSDMLWTAPELIRERLEKHASYVRGTQAGDIYSFGVILHETTYQTGPLGLRGGHDISPKEIIKNLLEHRTPPVRPSIPGSVKPTKLINCMKDCCAEDPKARPTIETLYEALHSVKKYRVSIIDNVIKMMEDYHVNLEHLIAERAQQLTENINKTTDLLYKMMPMEIVKRLVAGERCFSNEFAEASVFFSGISGFSTISQNCAPMDIVEILDKLFRKLDEVVVQYKVYKVETVEDTYVVGCGVPVPNPRHNFEIAEMALSMRIAVANFKVPQMNNRRLYIQIGLHCGPLAAGVIGSIRPRYCLFGDTVNMASRMMSTGAAMRIQLSHQMYASLWTPDSQYLMVERGVFHVKGKGRLTTYFLEGQKGKPWFFDYPETKKEKVLPATNKKQNFSISDFNEEF